MPRGRGFGRGKGHGGPPTASRLSRFVEPAVLLALQRGQAAHGYDLVVAANELGLTEAPIDAAAVYRVLRQLEQQGLVTSTWDTSGSGPARRNYDLTSAGEERLRQWVDVIERRAEAFGRFAKQARSGQSASSGDRPPQEE